MGLCDISVEEMSSKTLKDLAASIHEKCKAMTKNAAKRWCLWHRAFEYRVAINDFVCDEAGKRRPDMSITINNNSKRDAPDFGAVAGGVASEFMSNMGPTLF